MSYCFSGSSIKFQGHTGCKIDDLNPIWVRLLGRSQLSNPSDLPCCYPELFHQSVKSLLMMFLGLLATTWDDCWLLTILSMVSTLVIAMVYSCSDQRKKGRRPNWKHQILSLPGRCEYSIALRRHPTMLVICSQCFKKGCICFISVYFHFFFSTQV